MPRIQHSSCCEKDVNLAPMQMPNRTLGAMYHASTSPCVLPAVVAHALSPRPSCRELQAIQVLLRMRSSVGMFDRSCSCTYT